MKPVMDNFHFEDSGSIPEPEIVEITPEIEDISSAEWQRQYLAKRRLEKSGLPPRYAGKTVQGFETANDDQKRLKSGIAAYLRESDGLDGLSEPNGIIIAGPKGTGKTHLAAACLRELIRRGKSGLYLLPVEFFTRVKSTFGKTRFDEDGESEMIGDVCAVDVLLLDDLGTSKAGQEWEGEKIYQIVNRRMLDGKITLITTNHAFPGKLAEFVGERVVSRIYEACRIFSTTGQLDYRINYQKAYKE